MGYRSDVAVVIYGDGRDAEKYELIKTLMNTAFKDVLIDFKSNAEWHDNAHTNVLEFKLEDVKWYDNHPEVQRFMHMLDEIGDIEGLNYEFLRVGEDADDIESKSEGQYIEYILSVTRSIRVDL